MLDITDISVSWKGVTRHLTREEVMKAFDRAPFGSLSDSSPRYFVEIDGVIKSVDAVFREIVSTPDTFDNSTSEKIARAFESLGFEVLDRRRHHIR